MKETNILKTQSTTKLIIKFSIPSIIGMLVGALYNVVDQLFIGNYVGFLGNGATNICFPLTTICLALALMGGIGTAAEFNINLGQGNYEKASKYIGNGFSLMAIFSIIYSLITWLFLKNLLVSFGATNNILPLAYEYGKIIIYGFPLTIITIGGSHIIRADGSPIYSMSCSLVGCILNIILDYYFMAILNMKISGAAIATVISQGVSFLMVVYYLFHFKTDKLTLKDFIPNFKFQKNIIKTGIGPFFNQSTILFVQVILNNLFRYYGNLSIYGSDIPLAATGVIMKVNMLYFAICIGISQGMQPIISYNYGSKDYKRVIETVKKGIFLTICIGTIASLIFQLFPLKIIQFFGKGNQIYYEFAVKFFRIFLFFTFLNGSLPLLMNLFTSIAKPKKAVFIALSRQVIFLIPLALILSKFFLVDGILYAALISDFISIFISFYLGIKELKSMKEKIKI